MMVVNTQCSGLWRTPDTCERAFNILVERRRIVFAFFMQAMSDSQTFYFVV